jgi:hypothetical protein
VAVNREALRAARSVAARFAKEGGTFVTVQDTGGDFGLSGSERAWLAGPAALARTAAIEWPSAHVRAIDVGRVGRSPDEVAEALCAELLSGGVEREVGFPSREPGWCCKRFRRRCRPARLCRSIRSRWWWSRAGRAA